jgi:hypothetical protein
MLFVADPQLANEGQRKSVSVPLLVNAVQTYLKGSFLRQRTPPEPRH